MSVIRIFRIPGIAGIQWRLETKAPRWLSYRFHLRPSQGGFENFSFQFGQQRTDQSITILCQEKAISPDGHDSIDDLLLLSDDLTYEYRTLFMGYSGILTACVWSLMVMPNGGWFALLFKDIALPIFSGYSAIRATDSWFVMRGSERLLQTLRDGDFEFKLVNREKSH
jgi:hypothetical protein